MCLEQVYCFFFVSLNVTVFQFFFSISFVTDTEKVSTNLECISNCVVLCALDVQVYLYI